MYVVYYFFFNDCYLIQSFFLFEQFFSMMMVNFLFKKVIFWCWILVLVLDYCYNIIIFWKIKRLQRSFFKVYYCIIV